MLESEDGQGGFFSLPDQQQIGARIFALTLLSANNLANTPEPDSLNPGRQFMSTAWRNGKQQFQVFAPVQEMFCRSLWISGKQILEDTRSHAALPAQAGQINREAVAQVNHGGGQLPLAQKATNRQAGLRI